MRFQLLTVGTRLPAWVNDGYAEYQKRLPRECELELIELPLGRRTAKQSPQRAIQDEGDRMLARIASGSEVVALDERGKSWNTQQLADRMRDWVREGSKVTLLVGGPDGLDPRCRECAHSLWSLSPLTLPHGMVRVMLAEQIYRAWSLLHNHPYHRA